MLAPLGSGLSLLFSACPPTSLPKSAISSSTPLPPNKHMDFSTRISKSNSLADLLLPPSSGCSGTQNEPLGLPLDHLLLIASGPPRTVPLSLLVTQICPLGNVLLSCCSGSPPGLLLQVPPAGLHPQPLLQGDHAPSWGRLPQSRSPLPTCFRWFSQLIE